MTATGQQIRGPQPPPAVDRVGQPPPAVNSGPQPPPAAFRPGDTTHCHHRGRIATRERFAPVTVEQRIGDRGFYYVRPFGAASQQLSFCVGTEDLGTLDDLAARWGEEPARGDAMIRPHEVQGRLFG